MTWQDEMKTALIGRIITNGGLVRETATRQDYGGWREYGWDDATGDDAPALTTHMRACTVDLALSTWTDSDWEEFNGTFAEPPWVHRKGTDAIVYCGCGLVQGRHWRYAGPLAELIRAITAAPPGAAAAPPAPELE